MTPYCWEVVAGPLNKQEYMSGKDVFPPQNSRRSFFKRRNSCGHESMVTTPTGPQYSPVKIQRRPRPSTTTSQPPISFLIPCTTVFFSQISTFSITQHRSTFTRRSRTRHELKEKDNRWRTSEGERRLSPACVPCQDARDAPVFCIHFETQSRHRTEYAGRARKKRSAQGKQKCSSLFYASEKRERRG